MKRMRSSDCMGALISGSPSTDEKNSNYNNNNDSSIYTRGFQTMTERLEEDCLEETSCYNITEKKRRLTADQVRALEKNFEFENKLDPERKIRLARELSLNPRQVAIWFQNRRARSKTKQLELDYGFLKANYDDLRLKFVELHQSKELLLLELNLLKSKIMKENTESNVSVKDEVLISEEDVCKGNVNHDDDQANFENNNGRGILMFGAGSSDCSDSSAILNEEVNINNNYYRPTMAISSSPTSDSMTISSNAQNQGHQQQTFVKMEEHRIFGGEESCDFFSDEQAPTLHWDCQGPWN